MVVCWLFQGGDVLQETIAANTSEDTVSLEFQGSDGTLITQLVDFTTVSFLLSLLTPLPVAESSAGRCSSRHVTLFGLLQLRLRLTYTLSASRGVFSASLEDSRLASSV